MQVPNSGNIFKTSNDNFYSEDNYEVSKSFFKIVMYYFFNGSMTFKASRLPCVDIAKKLNVICIIVKTRNFNIN